MRLPVGRAFTPISRASLAVLALVVVAGVTRAADPVRSRAARAPSTTVIHIEKRGSCLLFEPKHAVVATGDHVYWVNQTGADIDLRFSNQSPFKKYRKLTIADGEIGGGVVHAQANPGQQIRHPYVTFPAPCPVIQTGQPRDSPGPDVIVDGGGLGGRPKKR